MGFGSIVEINETDMLNTLVSGVFKGNLTVHMSMRVRMTRSALLLV